MLKIIGVGDNVVDKYSHLKMIFPGGNCVNFAVYGKNLGHKSAYMGVLAKDYEGEFLKKTLSGLSIDISMCEYVEGETGICSTILKDGDRTISDDNDLGAVKSTPLNLTPERIKYISDFDLAHSSCFSFIEDELYKIKNTGTALSYDFSDIWEEKDFEKVCPNIDIAFFSGKKLPDEKLKDLLKIIVKDYKCRLAITTIGKRGAIIYDGNKYYTSPPFNLDAKVVDTLGAGDSFFTGFITAYYEGLKSFDNIVENKSHLYITENDKEIYLSNLTEYSMSFGNLLAVRNCMLHGAFGMGVSY